MQETNLDEDAPLLENLDDILRHLQLSDAVLLPMGVCSGCKEKAEFVLRFWQECNDAQDNLRVIFNQDHTIELLATEIPANDYQQVAHDDVCHTVDAAPEAENVEHDYDSRFNYMLTQHKIREHNMHFEGVKLYTKPHLRNKNMRKRVKKDPEPQQKTDYVDEGASEIVEYDSIAIDINPVDGSEISRETYIVEQIDDNHHLQP
uniref:ZAD domain-containing protein n=1 Tax=Anopheles atroparvus TaxID=41427 RepID=A0A182JA84_ANOAO